MDKLTTTFASASCCLLVLASLFVPAQADGLDSLALTDAAAIDCGVSDTEATASGAGDVEDPIEDRDCYILGLDGVDQGVNLSLPGTDCEGTDGPVAGTYFPAGTPPRFFALDGDEPVTFGFTCAGDQITCLSLTASTSKTGGGEASATSECSVTSAHCESPGDGDKCVDKYVGLHEAGPWHCSLHVHVKWYGGSAHASCEVTYS